MIAFYISPIRMHAYLPVFNYTFLESFYFPSYTL